MLYQPIFVLLPQTQLTSNFIIVYLNIEPQILFYANMVKIYRHVIISSLKVMAHLKFNRRK